MPLWNLGAVAAARRRRRNWTRAPSHQRYWPALWWASRRRTRTSTASGCWLAAWCDLGVCDAAACFTPSTRVVSGKEGRLLRPFKASDRDAARQGKVGYSLQGGDGGAAAGEEPRFRF